MGRRCQKLMHRRSSSHRSRHCWRRRESGHLHSRPQALVQAAGMEAARHYWGRLESAHLHLHWRRLYWRRRESAHLHSPQLMPRAVWNRQTTGLTGAAAYSHPPRHCRQRFLWGPSHRPVHQRRPVVAAVVLLKSRRKPLVELVLQPSTLIPHHTLMFFLRTVQPWKQRLLDGPFTTLEMAPRRRWQRHLHHTQLFSQVGPGFSCRALLQ